VGLCLFRNTTTMVHCLRHVPDTCEISLHELGKARMVSFRGFSSVVAPSWTVFGLFIFKALLSFFFEHSVLRLEHTSAFLLVSFLGKLR
jgi:hypothetical protein